MSKTSEDVVKGCGDSSCIVEPPSHGTHTNGGCRCQPHMIRWALDKAQRELRWARSEQPRCGHPNACIIRGKEGTSYCGACEREAKSVAQVAAMTEAQTQAQEASYMACGHVLACWLINSCGACVQQARAVALARNAALEEAVAAVEAVHVPQSPVLALRWAADAIRALKERKP